MKKIYITEAQWNFHHGKEHDMKPYGSESKFVCYHETGQFGSGTYFSTFNGDYERNDDLNNYGDNYKPYMSEFIQVDGKGIYRVDMSIYQNLYRVRFERQGDVLHTMMGDLNRFFHKVSGFGLGHYQRSMANYDNSVIYQRISKNASALNLNCPSYLKLTRMAQELAMNEDDRRSFSTVFMEYNGFNGVNVSGVDKFDNSRHGSVIYDLSKVSSKMMPINDKFVNPRTIGYGHTNSIASSIYDLFKDSAMTDSLLGKFKGLGVSDMTETEKLRLMKNIIANGECPNASELRYYFDNDPKVKRYIFHKMFDGSVDADIVCDDKMMDYIVDNGQVYFVNYDTSNARYCYRGFLEKFLDKYKWDDYYNMTNEKLKKYLDHILSALKRPLNDEEKEYIENDYYIED